ncbi:MAG: hypothetical protein NTY19_16695 [Planctomycetota bacterium]|nr:hypothetical protein [Planctomycetota bacterium]
MATDATPKPLTKMEELYQQRLSRYVTAMRNEQPDMVPIRPFVAEFVGTHAGYTCQALAHDFGVPRTSIGTRSWPTWSTCGPD